MPYNEHKSLHEQFFEHFLFISDAMTYASDDQQFSLWNDNDGFYYDAITWGAGHSQQLPVRSLVGLIPLYATLVLEPGVIKRFPGFKKRMDWFIENRPDISERNVASLKARGRGERLLLALASKERLVRILEKMLDEKEFLSEYGVRSWVVPFAMPECLCRERESADGVGCRCTITRILSR